MQFHKHKIINYIFLFISFIFLYPVGAEAMGFYSNKGFKVDYPSSWFLVGDSKSELDIISGKERAQGVVITRGEAEIIVQRIDKSASYDLRSFLHHQYDVGLSPSNIKEKIVNSETKCDLLEKLDGTFEITKNVAQDNTFYACSIGDMVVLVTYTRWSGDVQNPSWDEDVWRILQSIDIP